MAVLSDDEVRNALAELEGWERSGDAIVREFPFPGFSDAVAFVVRLAFDAEAANHHPDVDIRYNKVRVALSTHSEGGITAKDVDLARAIQDRVPGDPQG
ncbi:MAG: 4a-hydroxytetrahydrobiopterin dehydratase [Actinomycetota bacterium]|nr:4a-hydroxytetrahydrobiopterin dehydratase [Actinomycetota bacterium]